MVSFSWLFLLYLVSLVAQDVSSFSIVRRRSVCSSRMGQSSLSSTANESAPSDSTTAATDDEQVEDDIVITIKPKAMERLQELQSKQSNPEEAMVLRMGVRNGGCSGLSYVMDFSTEEEIQDDDAVDAYSKEKIKCVVDAKSMLYLYGLELDYSDELIGGGFKFFNPNAEDSCGCGSSFGV